MSGSHVCTHGNIRLSRGGKQFLDSNIKVMRLQFVCEGCGQAFRAIGVHEGVSIDAPSSRDGGATVMVPIVPVGEEPDHVGAMVA